MKKTKSKNKYSKYTAYHNCLMPECTERFSDKEIEELSKKLEKFLNGIPSGVLEGGLRKFYDSPCAGKIINDLVISRLSAVLEWKQ